MKLPDTVPTAGRAYLRPHGTDTWLDLGRAVRVTIVPREGDQLELERLGDTDAGVRLRASQSLQLRCEVTPWFRTWVRSYARRWRRERKARSRRLRMSLPAHHR